MIVPSSFLTEEEGKLLSKLLKGSSRNNNNVTVLFEYSSKKDVEPITREISACIDQNISTGILCPYVNHDPDTITMTNGVAQILDDAAAAGGGGLAGKYLYVTGNRIDSDSILEVVEELSYLDITGPTLISRIIVDVTNNNNIGSEEDDDDDDDDDWQEEAVEGCLMMGVNKFAVEESQLDWLDQIVRKEGKKSTFRTTLS